MVSGYLTGCIRFTAPCHFGPFGPHSKFEVLLAKAFSLKQTKKQNQILPVITEKIKF